MPRKLKEQGNKEARRDACGIYCVYTAVLYVHVHAWCSVYVASTPGFL